MGISFDTPAEQAAFRAKEGFEFDLLCDTTTEAGTAYEAKKAEDEPWPDFPRRITYLIDPEGKIAKGYEVSDVAGHPQTVLDDLLDLQNS